MSEDHVESRPSAAPTTTAAPVDVSIVICTRDHADSLVETLRSLAETRAPVDLEIELLVVDNGSSDRTAEVVAEARFQGVAPRYVLEPIRGLDAARNRGVRDSTGTVVLFCDDDVRVPRHWVGSMAQPILQGRFDAVGGGVRTAPHLKRDWRWTPMFDIEHEPPAGLDAPLIGANCAFSREVFERVPRFDDELDAGRLGFAGDSLFAAQVGLAGFRIGSIIGSTFVVHHFDADRLRTTSLVQAAEKKARSDAYVQHHWLHVEARWFWGRYLYREARAALGFARWRPGERGKEGISQARWNLVSRSAFYRQLRRERTRQRNYAMKGLVKLNAAEELSGERK